MELFQDADVYLDLVRRFVQDEVLPHTREWEANEAFPDDIWTRLGELGLLSLLWPREKGGQGLKFETFCHVVREMSKGDPALAMNVSALNALAVGHFAKFATAEQVEKYIPGILSGHIKMAWALTEPDAGSDAKRVNTRGTPIEGRAGFYHLNGRKMFITNGGKADLVVLLGRISDKELTAFILETDQPGFKVEKRIRTVGVSASNTAQFSLTDAVAWHTPCTFEDALGLLHPGRLGIASMAVGIGEKALELSLDYSKQREQFNRRLADMQSVQNMLADSAVELTASWLLVMDGARRYDAGQPFALQSSYAKLYAGETVNRVTNRAIQIHGGRGMTKDFLVEKLWRDAKLTEIGEGCSEIQRLVIAKTILK